MRKFLGGGFVYGIPARDLTEREWAELTKEQRDCASTLYKRLSAEKPKPAKKTRRQPVAVKQSAPIASSGLDPLLIAAAAVAAEFDLEEQRGEHPSQESE